jgi:hypothetical protein
MLVVVVHAALLPGSLPVAIPTARHVHALTGSSTHSPCFGMAWASDPMGRPSGALWGHGPWVGFGPWIVHFLSYFLIGFKLIQFD